MSIFRRRAGSGWQVIRESQVAAVALALIGAARVQMFHDHVPVKEPGTSKPAPWHQDGPCRDTAKPGLWSIHPPDHDQIPAQHEQTGPHIHQHRQFGKSTLPGQNAAARHRQPPGDAKSAQDGLAAW